MKAEKLADAIMDELTEYTEDTTEIVKEAVKETADEVKNDIRSNAPIGATGKYEKSWRSKKKSEDGSMVTYTVYADKNGYRLAHLLEYGHAMRNGGRTKAQPHIKPAEEKGLESLEQKLERKI